MTREECFATWAPDDVIWSEWAKPVAFASEGGPLKPEPVLDSQLPSIPVSVDSGSAVVVDLPGAEAPRSWTPLYHGVQT